MVFKFRLVGSAFRRLVYSVQIFEPLSARIYVTSCSREDAQSGNSRRVTTFAVLLSKFHSKVTTSLRSSGGDRRFSERERQEQAKRGHRVRGDSCPPGDLPRQGDTITCRFQFGPELHREPGRSHSNPLFERRSKINTLLHESLDSIGGSPTASCRY